MAQFNYEQNRFGSAGWASDYECARAGLFTPSGPRIGYMGRRGLHFDSDAPMITVAGSGAGKNRDVLIDFCCTFPGPALIMDVKGENAAVSSQNLIRNQKYGYFINPYFLHDMACHTVNLLDLLKPDSGSLDGDCTLIAEMLVKGHRGDNSWVSDAARHWMDAFFKIPDLARSLCHPDLALCVYRPDSIGP